ncbi:MAG: hypothetical protein PHR25_00435 [Clostridia bacterium]|nr:hypothetical protein [Clostridia bacterium]MDD4375240.1 hypothetical protein [Clostridia bacterium]
MNSFPEGLDSPFTNSFQNDFFNNTCSNIFDGLDLNKLLVIILLITGNLTVEAITVYPNDFAVTLGTFRL